MTKGSSEKRRGVGLQPEEHALKGLGRRGSVSKLDLPRCLGLYERVDGKLANPQG